MICSTIKTDFIIDPFILMAEDFGPQEQRILRPFIHRPKLDQVIFELNIVEDLAMGELTNDGAAWKIKFVDLETPALVMVLSIDDNGFYRPRPAIVEGKTNLVETLHHPKKGTVLAELYALSFNSILKLGLISYYVDPQRQSLMTSTQT